MIVAFWKQQQMTEQKNNTRSEIIYSHLVHQRGFTSLFLNFKTLLSMFSAHSYFNILYQSKGGVSIFLVMLLLTNGQYILYSQMSISVCASYPAAITMICVAKCLHILNPVFVIFWSSCADEIVVMKSLWEPISNTLIPVKKWRWVQ